MRVSKYDEVIPVTNDAPKEKRIFLEKTQSGLYICVSYAYTEEFRNGEPFKYEVFGEIKENKTEKYHITGDTNEQK